MRRCWFDELKDENGDLALTHVGAVHVQLSISIFMKSETLIPVVLVVHDCLGVKNEGGILDHVVISTKPENISVDVSELVMLIIWNFEYWNPSH